MCDPRVAPGSEEEGRQYSEELIFEGETPERDNPEEKRGGGLRDWIMSGALAGEGEVIDGLRSGE